MVGILCALEILLMAGVAERRSAGINPIHMAGSAIGGHVRPCQRIAGLLIVVEGRRRPSRRSMTDRAICLKRRERVNWLSGRFEISLMTGHALFRGAGVTLRMAVIASERLMRAS